MRIKRKRKRRANNRMVMTPNEQLISSHKNYESKLEAEDKRLTMKNMGY